MFKNFFRHCISKFGYQISPIKKHVFSEPSILGKAKNFKERFKDVISDPLNFIYLTHVHDTFFFMYHHYICVFF